VLSKVKRAIVDVMKPNGDVSFIMPVQALKQLIEKEIELVVVKTPQSNVILLPETTNFSA
jgi:hypothetical protein